MPGKHRQPRRGAGRNLAATAAVLTAGALPLAAAGSAFADAAPAAQSPLSALPLSSLPVSSLPVSTLPVSALPAGLNSVAGPVQGTLPLAGTIAGAMTGAIGSGELPVGGVLGKTDPRAAERDAAVDEQTAMDTAALAVKATELAGAATSNQPVNGLMQQMAPAPQPVQMPVQLAPTLLHDGAVGTMTDGFSAQTVQLTSRVADQMRPTVLQLQQSGVPTVGNVTSALSQAKVPVFGTVGGLTSAIPVSEMVGDQSPVIGAMGAASSL